MKNKKQYHVARFNDERAKMVDDFVKTKRRNPTRGEVAKINEVAERRAEQRGNDGS